MLTFLFVCVVGYASFLFLMQRQILFPRPHAPNLPVLPSHVEQMWLGEDRVEAWLLLPETVPESEPWPVVIFNHGNGELIDFWREPFEVVRSWGVAVLLVEYPGYGRSGGKPSQTSITATQIEAFDALAQDSRFDPQRIIGYGRSLGGGAACALAEHRELAALILESSFTSVRPLARKFAMPGFLVLDPFDNIKILKAFQGPVLVIHGDWDRIIPVDHAERLAYAAGAELKTLDCGHNDCPRPWPLLRDFLVRAEILH